MLFISSHAKITTLPELLPRVGDIATVFYFCRHVGRFRWQGGSAPVLGADDAVVDGKTRFFDVPGIDRCIQRAVRLAVMAAVPEAALAEIGAEFPKSAFDVLAVEVAEAEFLEAWRVDQMAVGIEEVERCVRRRMLAGIEGLRDFPGGGIGLGDQGVDQGRLAHSGLADEDAGLALKVRSKIFGVVEGR